MTKTIQQLAEEKWGSRELELAKKIIPLLETAGEKAKAQLSGTTYQHSLAWERVFKHEIGMQIIPFITQTLSEVIDEMVGAVPEKECYYKNEPDHENACHKISSVDSRPKCPHCRDNQTRKLLVARGDSLRGN